MSSTLSLGLVVTFLLETGSTQHGASVQLPHSAPGLLNKICPENVDSIIEKIAAIKVEDLKQLEVRAARARVPNTVRAIQDMARSAPSCGLGRRF